MINTVIVKTAMDCAKLVLLCYHADKHSKDIFFPSKHRTNCTKCRVWDEKKTTDGLGSNVCLVILFIHAILGVTLLKVAMTWYIHNTENGIKQYKVTRNCTDIL